MNRFATIKAELQQILGPDIGIGVTDPKAPGDTLLPEEESVMAYALEKRKLEFTSGRVAARQAMRDLNHAPKAVPLASDRSPIWPDGLMGSITHSNDVCIVAVTERGSKYGIGIDIEPDTPLESNLENFICTPFERAWLDMQCTDRRGHLAKQVFCMKESIYKALYPLTQQVIGFDKVEIEPPLENITHFVLKSGDRAKKISIETKLATIGDSIFTYTNLMETPFLSEHGNKSQ